ncbi:unnamed protein product [Pleuronectes platessa]|uniref:Uncharacterized protein n=1 Tax=Pleuronectes platessa TaxID=8262 RepID=A0A9N7YVP7_PLEPL|nr:unnamed protein product [Pleuronectes platessa]
MQNEEDGGDGVDFCVEAELLTSGAGVSGKLSVWPLLLDGGEQVVENRLKWMSDRFWMKWDHTVTGRPLSEEERKELQVSQRGERGHMPSRDNSLPARCRAPCPPVPPVTSSPCTRGEQTDCAGCSRLLGPGLKKLWPMHAWLKFTAHPENSLRLFRVSLRLSGCAQRTSGTDSEGRAESEKTHGANCSERCDTKRGTGEGAEITAARSDSHSELPGGRAGRTVPGAERRHSAPFMQQEFFLLP